MKDQDKATRVDRMRYIKNKFSSKVAKVEQVVMGSGQFAKCVVYLCVSGVCCLLAAGVGIVRSRTLKDYLATLGEEVRRD